MNGGIDEAISKGEGGGEGGGEAGNGTSYCGEGTKKSDANKLKMF